MSIRSRIARSLYCAVLASAGLSCVAALPPPVSPALQRALQDSAGTTRVYEAPEVAEPVISAPNNRPPSFRGAPDGRAAFRFVVDTSGRVEVATIELQAGSEPALARPVFRMLPTWRYLPARLPDGRRVRQLAELTVIKTGESVAIRLSTDKP